MSEVILKNFLVGIGYKIDEAGAKRFADRVQASSSAVENLGRALTAIVSVEAVRAFGAGLERMASNLEQLFFSAQRTSTSATHLKTLQLAAENLGVSAEEAMGNFEGLARAIATQPGMAGLLGIHLVDENGKPTDEKSWMHDLHERFAGTTLPLATMLAQQAGISYNMMRALRSDNWDKEVDASAQLTANYDETAKQAHEVEVQLRRLGTRWDALKLQFEKPLLDAVEPQLQNLDKWLNDHQDDIKNAITDFTVGMQSMGTIVGPILTKVQEGWRLIFDEVRDTGKSIQEWLPEDVQNGIGWTIGKALDSLGIRDPVDEMLGNTHAPGKPADMKVSSGHGFGERLGQWFNAGGDWFARHAERINQHGRQTKVEDMVRDFMAMGWTIQQSIGIAAQAVAESSLHADAWNGTHYGLFQLSKERQTQYEALTGKRYRDASVQEQEAFLNYELRDGTEQWVGNVLRNANSVTAAGWLATGFERPWQPGNKSEEAAFRAERANTAVTINQNMNFPLSGTDTAQRKRELEDALRSSNEKLARTLSSNVR